MGQFGFFDAGKRLAVISAKGDPLEMIDRVRSGAGIGRGCIYSGHQIQGGQR